MWGPLKDTGKEGFTVRRQAEKQQPVYRLILLCVPNLVAASCEVPPLSFSSLSAPPCLTFLAAASCMGAFPEQKQICLVRCHFLSLDPCLFYHVWKLNREPIVRKRMFCLCFVTLCFASHLLCIVCSFLCFLAKTQFNGDIFNFVQFLKDFLACF